MTDFYIMKNRKIKEADTALEEIEFKLDEALELNFGFYNSLG